MLRSPANQQSSLFWMCSPFETRMHSSCITFLHQHVYADNYFTSFHSAYALLQADTYHHVYADNYFTSFHSAYALLQADTYHHVYADNYFTSFHSAYALLQADTYHHVYADNYFTSFHSAYALLQADTYHHVYADNYFTSFHSAYALLQADTYHHVYADLNIIWILWFHVLLGKPLLYNRRARLCCRPTLHRRCWLQDFYEFLSELYGYYYILCTGNNYVTKEMFSLTMLRWTIKVFNIYIYLCGRTNATTLEAVRIGQVDARWSVCVDLVSVWWFGFILILFQFVD